MDKKIYELINDQINKELYSAYLYLEIADYYKDAGLDGYANFYEIQAKEERDHALIFRKYLLENDETPKLLAIDADEVKDYRAMQFLKWFIDEQMEEEDTARDMITKMELFGDDKRSLYELDQALQQRAYSTPSPLANE